jgi:hypothetical protein
MSVNASPAATFQMIPTKLLFRFAKAVFNRPAFEGDAQDFSKRPTMAAWIARSSASG